MTSQSCWGWYRAVSKKLSWLPPGSSSLYVRNGSKLQVEKKDWTNTLTCLHISTHVHLDLSEVLFCMLTNSQFIQMILWKPQRVFPHVPELTWIMKFMFALQKFITIESYPWLNRYSGLYWETFLFKKNPTKLDSYLDYHGFLTTTWKDENHANKLSCFFFTWNLFCLT